MEPQYSVMVYSKYSEGCKSLFELIERSGINFNHIRLLCIDNPEVRKRVLNHKELQIQAVPCLLNMYQGGAVEKFEGEDLFSWIRGLIEKLTPPPPPRLLPQPPPPPPPQEEVEEEERPRQPQRQPPKRPPQKPKATPIDAIPLEDEEPREMTPDSDDRHRTVVQPKRIRQDEGEYIESEELFSGDQPELRQESSKSIKNTTQKAQQDPHGTMARMLAMAKERAEIEQTSGNPARRPFEDRRP